MKKQQRLPRTSRVNDKIMDYYMRFGQERDLEKFMRLYSPAASSSKSRTSTAATTTTASNTSDNNSNCSCASACSDIGSGVMRRLFAQQTEQAAVASSSRSLPNMSMEDKQQQQHTNEEEEAAVVQADTSTDVIIIPIRTEGIVENRSQQAMQVPAACYFDKDPYKTPKKLHKIEEKLEIRTPDSVAKIHKRLEWDSLADVGYPKSKSTSNISTIERSLLRELFQDHAPSDMLQTNASESDLKKLQSEQKRGVLMKKTPTCQNTPPLASSTFNEPHTRKQHASIACQCSQPGEFKVESKKASGHKQATSTKSTTARISKMVDMSTNTSAKSVQLKSIATCTSLLKVQDKGAQTFKEELRAKEVQVDMSSLSSAMGGSMTPSSFEEYSSRDDNNDGDADGGDLVISCRRSTHPFIVGISEMLAQRRAIVAENKERTDRSVQRQLELDSLQKIHDTFRSVLEEGNKENRKNNAGNSRESKQNKQSATQSNSSGSVQTSLELDLGIQLLCSLIEAKSLKQRQKHKLVREIVKRILRLSGEQQAEISKQTATGSSSSTTEHKHRTSSTDIDNISRLVLESLETSGRVQQDSKDNDGECLENNKPNRQTENFKTALEQPKIHTKASQTGESLTKLQPSSAQQQKQSNSKETKMQNKSRMPLANANFQEKQTSLAARQSKAVRPNEHGGRSSSDKYALTTPSNSGSAGSTSHTSEPTTQKPAHIYAQAESACTDVDQQTEPVSGTTMREWLNPLTQSEIAYEERKRVLAENALKLEKAQRKLRKTSASKEPERQQQINWLDSEIKRLESLRALLAKEDSLEQSQNSSSSLYATIANTDGRRTSEMKLYDTVHSTTAKSSILSESAERQAEEIAHIIEDCTINETVEHKKEQLIKSSEWAVATKSAAIKTAEQIIEICQTTKPYFKHKPAHAHEDNVTPPPLPPRQHQRSKISTPSDSNGSESVGSFVQQRKSIFIEQYKHKKQSHYEALLRQQQQEAHNLKQQKIELLEHEKRKQHCQNCQPHRVHVYHDKHEHVMPLYCKHCPVNLPYTTAAIANGHKKNRSTQVALDGRSQKEQQHHHQHHHHRHSNSKYSNKSSLPPTPEETPGSEITASSLFCTTAGTSTDVSIPMGSKNTTSTSTTTTTHQYDEVVAATAAAAARAAAAMALSCKTSAIGVQTDCTGYSRCTSSSLLPHAPQRVYQPTQRTACVQVKPKGIAYIIQFDKSNEKLQHDHDHILHSDSSQHSSNSQSQKEKNLVQQQQDNDIELPLTLQEHLKIGKPKFVAHSKARKALLNELQALRQAREREMRDILENASMSSMERHLDERLPPPATSKVRLFPSRQMKAMTRRSVANLPEVLAKQQREKEERRRRSNRILRDIFNRRLQRRVHKGKLSLNHSHAVI